MNTLYIMCGISGSGKSTYANSVLKDAMYFSADDYFMIGGEYLFEPKDLPDAHATCLKNTLNELIHGNYDIVVDNTNTTVAEIAPYAALALAYGYKVEILRFECDVETGFERNGHGVPKNVIQGQFDRLQKLSKSLPPWWPVKTIDRS